MAALPSPTQVAGSHAAIYEAYYNQVDPNGCGQIGAMEAARFLKKSQLSDDVLSKIWDLADPYSRGALDKSGMYVALKLCALAQAGRDLSMANLSIEMPPPKMGDIPAALKKGNITALVITSISNGDWSIKPTERAKYDQLFDSLQPGNGYIPGNKVKGVLMDSKLPLDTLGKIWDLADMDKDGMLDRHEFVVAMHLVYKALEKYAIPSVLPPELMPPGKRKESAIPVSKSPVPQGMGGPPPIPPLPNVHAINTLVGLENVKPPAVLSWIVPAEDQIAADKLFLQADMDMDGFVSGVEIKDVFLQSGLPQSVLADIWGLCDINQSGKLNKEQFALAMWFIKQKIRGIDPPPSLAPDMMPPSLRKLPDGVVENNNISGYSNPELDMISKDIAELARERHTMEQDIAQKEADIKIKNGEIKSLQSELDTLAATLKQLENQKGEAQKRLNDLKAQVDKLRQQAEEQESVLRVQEEELNSKRQELEGLRQEEQELEQQQNKSRDQLNDLTKNLQNTQIQISQAKAKITHLEEQQRQMTDAIALYDSALATGDASIVPDTTLQYNPEVEEPECNGDTQNVNVNGVNGESAYSFSKANGPGELSGFGDQDLFASSKAKEAFGAPDSDPFENTFQSQANQGGFTTDPFAAFNNGATSKQDPYDPFGDGKKTDNKPTATTADPFGEDPFANLHAPPRPESPSPALPPKKAKQPPPRPAPPRPVQGPSGPLRAAPAPPTPSPTPDPFANANSDPFAAPVQGIADNNNDNTFDSPSTGFADFANFDSKPEPIPSRMAPPRPVSRPRTTAPVTASASASASALTSARLPDFTEDPFRDYRYEDPFAIADPFADETEDINANKSSNDSTPGKLDPFGFETTGPFEKTANFAKDFDSDFISTFPPNKPKSEKNQLKLEADFSKAFQDSNRNVKPFDVDFSNNFSNVKSKTIDIDQAFSSKTERPGRKSGLDIAHGFKDKLSFSDKKNRRNSDKSWNGNPQGVSLTEEQQLAWASQQSLKAEEERCRLKEQEDADLALAIELSRQEKSGKQAERL
ncbi:epidermal growth factor receptor substrate 15-like 1 isoform X2 [Orussus abietinus]|uniref:epidermal growth factor receptor substrate 15-like 1 isoform X2 n=1 Tax=Orussus abietinus TaxID=222816 RepID=UPI000625C951|nr:epidermal growth factor receptor substrate 15-like 1 isoform X2 [Orussus abietinus]